MDLKQRWAGKYELEEILDFWKECPRHSGEYNEVPLNKFLKTFTPDQIKGAMKLATSKKRDNYYSYLCGILNKWKRTLEQGDEVTFVTLK